MFANLVRPLRPLTAVAAVATLGALLPLAAESQGTLSQLQTDMDQIARHGRPSVVTVLSRRTLTHGSGRRAGLPRVQTRVGSGVAVAPNEILTTASVVQGAEQLSIRTDNGLTSRAQIVGVDPIYNLALLRVTDVLLPPMRMSTEREVHPGDWVITLGTSFRMQPTQSMGNVAYVLAEPRFSRLQLTNAAYPGNSGGAALNARGELVGIVQGELVQSSYAERTDQPRPGGMTFVLSLENVKRVYESLRREGRVAYGYLGVSTSGASIEALSEEGARVAIGAMVERVEPGSPAARAGLRVSDLIVAFDGERVEYSEQLARWVAATRPGTEIELVWVRGDEPRSARFAMGASPHQTPPWARGQTTAPATSASAAASGSTAERITDLERQVIRLNREITHLKGDTSTTGSR
jgi:serine protease Do